MLGSLLTWNTFEDISEKPLPLTQGALSEVSGTGAASSGSWPWVLPRNSHSQLHLQCPSELTLPWAKALLARCTVQDGSLSCSVKKSGTTCVQTDIPVTLGTCVKLSKYFSKGLLMRLSVDKHPFSCFGPLQNLSLKKS